jgi:AcrR family transcriptional regulator
MARQTPPDRLEKLLIVAASAFIADGFERTQMDDIAAKLGVSKGTIYRSFDSKESLFSAVLAFADNPDLLPTDTTSLAVNLQKTSNTLRDRLTNAIANLTLSEAIATPVPAKTDRMLRAQITEITLDLFDMMQRNRIAIMTLDRCAAEIPELAGDWYQSGRYAVVDLWVDYLDAHSDKPATVDHAVLARTIVEVVTVWAVKMPWDPMPRSSPTNLADQCASMVCNLVMGRSK